MVITRNPRTFLIDTGVFKLPLTDGTNGQAMVTDGEQNLSFTSIILGGSLSDLDLDTTIQVEEGADDDVVRIDVGDTPAGYGVVADIFTIASSGWTVAMGTANTATTAGAPISLTAGTGNTTGAGGAVTINAGTGGTSAGGNGGAITLTGGNAGAASGGAGGNIVLLAGTQDGAGAPGVIEIQSDLEALNAAGPALLNIATTGLIPTVVPNKANPTDGMGSAGSGNLQLIVGGANKLNISSSVITFPDDFRSNVAGGPSLRGLNSTAITPSVLPDFGDSATGVGGVTGTVSIISGAFEMARFDDDVGVILTADEGAGLAGGLISLTAGAGSAATGAGGAIDINAGAGNTTGAGGAVTIDGGTGGTSAGGNGGAITLTGGNAGAASGGAGGNIVLLAGTQDGAGAPGVIEIQSDLEATIAGGPAIRNEAASNTNPVFNPNKTNAGTGLGTDSSGNFSAFIHNGSEAFRFNTSGNLSLANVNTVLGASLLNETASATNPTLIPSGADIDTGVGTNALDELSIIAGGVEMMRFDEDVTDTITFTAASFEASNVFGPALLDIAGGPSAPTLIPDKADPDTGIGQATGDALSLIAGGAELMRLTETTINVVEFIAPQFRSFNLTGPVLVNEAVSTTNPTLIPFRTDLTSGIGSPFSGGLSFITSGVERVRVDTVRTTFFQNTEMISANSASLRNVSASATVPTIVPDDGTPTAGIGRNTAGSVSIITAGVERLRVDVTGNVIQLGPRQEGSAASSYAIVNETVSGTNPTLCPNRADQDTGIGQDVAGRVSIIGNSAENMRIQSGAAGETRFLIFDEDNGTLERVTVGVADSGGTGFKVLRIPN